MSIHQKGLNDKIQGSIICVKIEDNHPLILLGNVLPWSEFFNVVVPDLKSSTTKGKWWCGHALKVRIHLGVYILQQLLTKKDQQIEAEIKDESESLRYTFKNVHMLTKFIYIIILCCY